MAAIGLQSYHELSRKVEKEERQRYHADVVDDRWMHLRAILDYYDAGDASDVGPKLTVASPPKKEPPLRRHRPHVLSAELLITVWIPFWESNGYELQAFMWTLQTLHYYSPPSPPSSK